MGPKLSRREAENGQKPDKYSQSGLGNDGKKGPMTEIMHCRSKFTLSEKKNAAEFRPLCNNFIKITFLQIVDSYPTAGEIRV